MSAALVPDDPLLRAPGHELELVWRSSRHARRLLTLSLAGVLIALLAGRPEFAGVAAPALLLLAAGRAQRRNLAPARITVRVRLSAGRAFEGEAVALEVRAAGHGDRHIRWMLHPAAEINPGDVTTADGSEARFTLVAERWGRRRIGTMGVVVRDRWRLGEGHLSVILPVLDCYPGPTDQRTTVVLRRLPNRVGEHPARTAGKGIEFFGVREYLPGDRQRSINWPASTRRGRLQVNTFATERSQDVVLLADATSDVGEPGSSAVDLALRGATAAARAYLAGRDRVGVITYQWSGVSWLAPRLGRRQLDRIIVSMMASRPLTSRAGWARGASAWPAAGRAAARRADRGVQPAARPALRRVVAEHAGARPHHAGGGRAQRRAAGPPAEQRGPDGQADLADGEGGDQVLAARARCPRRALGRGSVPGPAAGRVRPPPAGGPPVTRAAGRGATVLPGLGLPGLRLPGLGLPGLGLPGPGLIGAGCVVWAAVPLIHTRYLTIALALASLFVAASTLRLALAEVAVPEDTYLLTAAVQFWLRFLNVVRLVPWEEGALVSVLWLEVLHPARPWHTAVLGAALIAYLSATHLAETGASPAVFRPQVRVLARGAGLLALGAGAGMVAAAGPGIGSALLRMVAAAALITAAVLVLPYTARGEARRSGSPPLTRAVSPRIGRGLHPRSRPRRWSGRTG